MKLISSLNSKQSGNLIVNKRYLSTLLNGDLSPTAEDQMQIYCTDSFRIYGNTGYIWYIANGQHFNGDDIDKCFMATKDMNDGEFWENWERYRGGNPSADAVAILDVGAAGTVDSKQVLVRTTFYDEDDGIWKMWYCGASLTLNSGYYYPMYATSSDGFTWNKYVNNPIYAIQIPPYGLVAWQVYKESPTLYHAIGTAELNVDTEGAVYETSTDGINWTNTQKRILIGTEARLVTALTKIGDDYIITANSGSNIVNSENYGGITTTIVYYSTKDFNTFTDLGDSMVKDEISEAGLLGGNSILWNGRYYTVYMYYKNQFKDKNAGGYNESFTSLRCIETSSHPSQIAGQPIIIAYPDYVLRYYPLCDDEAGDETQSPIERINGGFPTVSGTLVWDSRRQCLFTGTQKIIYPIYVNTLSDFSVKVNVYPYTTGVRLIAKQSGVWELINNAGKLEVKLYNSSSTLIKHYVTTETIERPPGVYDEYDEVKVGFTFKSGVLDLGFGDGLGKSVTKTVDNSMTSISLTSQVQIGELGETNSIRSLVLMTNPTEYQWLYEIDL